MARPEVGREPVGTLGPLPPGSAAEPVRREAARREPPRTDKPDRPERDRTDRRRDQREPRELSRRDRSHARRDARRDAQRLDVPRESRRLIRRPRFEDDTFGRFAEQFARFMGTATFLIYMTLFVILWMVWNVAAPEELRFDEFPFIFLTLMLSLQASYAAPLILLAQNRQAERDRQETERDRRTSSRTQADTEYLARELAAIRLALGEMPTRDYLDEEIERLREELERLRQRIESDGEVGPSVAEP